VLIGGIMEHIEQARGCTRAIRAGSLPPNGAVAGNPRGIARPDPQARQSAQRRGLDEHSVRHPKRRDLHPGGQSAGVAYRPPSFSKATGIPLAKVCSARHDGQDAGRAGAHCGTHSPVLLRQGGRVSVRQISRGRSHPRSGDEIHRRGDGYGIHLWRGLRQGRRRLPG